MNARQTKKIAKYSFILSILLHLLFFLFIATVITIQPEKQQKNFEDYVPAYTYKGAITPSSAPSHANKSQESQQNSQKSLEHEVPTDRDGLATQLQSGSQAHNQPVHPIQRSILDMSRDVIRQDQMRETMQDMQNIEPILLIGDKSLPPDPLIQLLGHALSANLIYPRMEGELGSKGRVLVAFIFHPKEGSFSNVRIVRSSDNPNFDNAALYAVNKAPKVIGADRFLPQPKYFVVGFVFE